MKGQNVCLWVTSVAAFAMVPFASVTTASAAVQNGHSQSSSTKSQTAQSPNLLSKAKLLTPSKIVPLPGGGTDYIYYINGVKNEFPVPPKGFNPLTATNAKLQEYGFPTRPTQSKQLQQWKSEMSKWKKTPIPKVMTIPGIEHRLSTTIASSCSSYPGVYCNPIWSGYYNNSSYNEWVGVQGDWKQPYVGSTPCSNADEVAWAGIGGLHTGSLLQAGSDMNFGGTPFAWYEYLEPGGGVAEQPLPKVNVHPGDSMHTYVSYQTSTGIADFYVADNTTGTSQPAKVTLNSNYYDGTTVEWVDERPSNCPTPTTCTPYNLLNYGSDPWTNAQSYSIYGYWNPIGALPNQQLFMEDSSGNVMSASSSLTTSSSFTDYYHQCS